MSDSADYPSLFRQMIVRSTEAALAAIDPSVARLDQEARERSQYVLGLALELPEAWCVARDLLLMVSPQMAWQGYSNEWIAYIEKGASCANNQGDLVALAKLHLQLAWFYRRLNLFDQAREYSLLSYHLSHQQGSTDTWIEALDQLSGIAVESSNLPGARIYIEELFQFTDVDDPRRAHSYSRLGFIALQQGEWERATYWYTEALRLFTLTNQHHFWAQAEQNLGFVYTYTGQYQQAIVHFRLSLQLFTESASVLDVAKTQMELGVVYWYLHDYSQALALYNLCEPVFVTAGSKVSLCHLYNNLGLAYLGNGNIEQAERSFSASIQLARELNMARLIANAMESLGVMYKKVGNVQEAVITWQQALQELKALPETPRYLHDLLVRRIQEVSNSGEPGAGFP